jgi:hypothetical protein
MGQSIIHSPSSTLGNSPNPERAGIEEPHIWIGRFKTGTDSINYHGTALLFMNLLDSTVPRVTK